MRLSDLRRVAVRNRWKVSFTTAAGPECVIDASGIVRVPELKGAPEFSASEEFGRATTFRIEKPAGNRVETQSVPREALERMCAGQTAAAAAEDHDE